MCQLINHLEAGRESVGKMIAPRRRVGVGMLRGGQIPIVENRKRFLGLLLFLFGFLASRFLGFLVYWFLESSKDSKPFAVL